MKGRRRIARIAGGRCEGEGCLWELSVVSPEFRPDLWLLSLALERAEADSEGEVRNQVADAGGDE